VNKYLYTVASVGFLFTKDFHVLERYKAFHIYQVAVVRIALLMIPSPVANHLTDALNSKDVWITFVGNEENKRKS